MYFSFQLMCGFMLLVYGYSVVKNPRVWGDQGRQAIKAENFEEYAKQNGQFALKVGVLMCVVAALDALGALDWLLYILIYVVGITFCIYPLVQWCRKNEGFSWPWPRVKSEKKRIKELRKQQEAEKNSHPEK